ncbi:hypothetical protein [Arcticibacter sp.]|uniref:hypothetical protein n=1 Tax=Arcticibacter sp. TaxID=1872630 RepID=UPI00388F3833
MRNIITFKDGLQIVEIDGARYQFPFSESDLADSIEEYNNDLSRRSGLDCDDYTPKEMAIEIASYWETEDVENMISEVTDDELPDYIIEDRKELHHAA